MENTAIKNLRIVPENAMLKVKHGSISIGSIRKECRGLNGQWMHYHSFSVEGFETPIQCEEDLYEKITANGILLETEE